VHAAFVLPHTYFLSVMSTFQLLPMSQLKPALCSDLWKASDLQQHSAGQIREVTPICGKFFILKATNSLTALMNLRQIGSCSYNVLLGIVNRIWLLINMEWTFTLFADRKYLLVKVCGIGSQVTTLNY
jgi:hypothetical protein